MEIKLPQNWKGRKSVAKQKQYDAEVEAFCAAILEIESTLDFKVSARGWCYIAEEYGLAKGNFDKAEKLIDDCRKSGLLPLDITARDSKRAA